MSLFFSAGAFVKPHRYSLAHMVADTIIATGNDTIAPTKKKKKAPLLTKEEKQQRIMDSVFAARTPIDIDTVNAELLHDSTSTDSLRKGKDSFDSPIHFEASDSLVYNADKGMMMLYGTAKVDYEKMNLTAAQISMNSDSSVVHAEGIKDTAGVWSETPVFNQGNDHYESQRMSYNFKTQKGFISNVNTTQGDGFVQSESSKRTDDGTLYLEHAKYTTCDAKHPHFYLKLSRAKVVPGKETIFGPAYLVVEDVPLPIGIPYGFFPFTKSYSSGIIVPSYGDETSRGFYLREGGYYFAINDYMDLRLLGEIYTKGSWGLSAQTNYKKRYKYNGNVYFSYLNTVEGDKGMPDYQKSTSFKLQWSHTMRNPGASNTSFSARVNFATQNFERKNLTSMYNPMSYTQSTRASSISFSHTFPASGFSVSGSMNLSQNMRDSTVTMTLPDLSFSLPRVYPFRSKHAVGKEKWYDKIAFSYTGQISNSISTKENKLLHSSLTRDWRNGMQHNIPIDATFQLFKYINISPNFTFKDVMYTNRINKSWDAQALREVADTVNGFYNLYNWNTSVSANTTLYGFYKPWKKLFGDKIMAIRHVFKPSVSFTYAPDFTKPKYGYTQMYEKVMANGEREMVKYSPYQNGIYGYPSSQKQGLITMSVSNNVEMKMKSEKDTTGFKKVSLIDELYASMSYNTAADVRPWSDLSTRIRLKLSKSYTFSMAAVFATYAYEFDKNHRVVQSNHTEWGQGRFGRFQGMSQNFSYTLNNETLEKIKNLFRKKDDRETIKGEQEEDNETMPSTDEANVDPNLLKNKNKKRTKVKAKVNDDGYLAFSMPWSLSLSYGITMFEDRSKPINEKRMRYPYGFTQSLNANGNIQIAQGWNINFSTGYDFKMKKISMTTASVSRDLHCFEMSCSMVLYPYSSFNFSFRARANELADVLKWDKRSSYSTNIEWY